MKPLIIANWKANKTQNDALFFLDFFKNYKGNDFVICAPFTLLNLISDFVLTNNLPIKVGAQDVSDFAQGPFTGEVTAEQIKDFAQYVLIGHSERRRLFGETQDDIKSKIQEAKRVGLRGIVCISNLDELEDIDTDDLIIAYEPIESIGTDKPFDANKMEEIASKIKSKKDVRVIYGGSVDADNVSEYTNKENIDGVLVGGESLTPENFLKLLENA